MKYRSITTSILLGLLTFATTQSGAQNDCWTTVNCENTYNPNMGCLPRLPATAYDCDDALWSGLFKTTCRANVDSCHPAPECPSCPKPPAKGLSAGQPIDLSTGDVYVMQTDVRIAGLGGGLSLERTWNSVWPDKETAYRQGLFGPNWRSTFEERVFTGSDGYMKYSRGDGSFWSFGFNPSAPNPGDGSAVFGLASPANQTAALIQGATSWTLTFQSGEQKVFDFTTGYLLSISDRNGNTTTLSYDSAFRLNGVTDPASRHLYFSYATPFSYLITGVTSDVGISLTYSYDEQGRLIQVTKPDNTTVHYQYDSDSRITAVLDSENKILEAHTYDYQSRGLTSSRAGGVEAVTVSYPQPPSPPPPED